MRLIIDELGMIKFVLDELSLPPRKEISRAAVETVHAMSPRRICFATTHRSALKHGNHPRYFGRFSVPFSDTIKPLFESMIELELYHSKEYNNYWRSIRDEAEFLVIQDWVNRQNNRVFLRDCLSLSLALSEHMTERGIRTEVGEIEYKAKYKKSRPAISRIGNLMADTIRDLPYYNDCDAIVAVPARRGIEFDFPTLLASQISEEIGITNLTEDLAWSGSKISLKGVSFDKKWDALERAGLEIDESAVSGKVVLLIDDLYQSGTTLQFVAMELQKAGAKRIYGLTTVKSLRDSDNV